jgi:hypothetical protein
MDTMKIKIKVGDCEFEADGPVETVQSQFDAFKEIVSLMPRTNSPRQTVNSTQTVENKSDDKSIPNVEIEKILHVAGRVVSLTAIPASTTDAALLIMLGHKDQRNNVSVTGQEIGDGLAQSGRPVPRVDRIMDDAIQDAYVLKTGVKRGTRYRLTNQGLVKALAVARDLMATLP